MRYDRHKAFPYPVLSGYSDDYTQAAFQASPEICINESGKVKVDVVFNLSEEIIASLIENGSAVYSILIKCSSTYFRQCMISRDKHLVQEIEPGQLHGKVDIFPFIISCREIIGYHSPRFNPEYHGRKFNIPASAVLALDEPITYYFDQEDLKRIGSVIELREVDMKERLVDYSIEEEKIVIRVSPEDKSRIDLGRNEPGLRDFIVMSIVMPVIAEILQISDSQEFAELHQEKKWFRALELKLQKMGSSWDNIDSNYLEIAQKILDYPLQRLKLPEPHTAEE